MFSHLEKYSYLCARFIFLSQKRMEKNLVIVESPSKANTIGKYLGKDYKVMSSFGHIRDLDEKGSGIGIDFTNDYKPRYVVSADKKKLVNNLKNAAKQAEVVWLASDEDREGEAIAWHLFDELGLDSQKAKRIVFHEITKEAILHAVENPRDIDLNLVDAQQARRVLDRIVGFELSPILWKKIKPALSAGRVQSVAVRLIVEREREIQQFTPEAAYRVTALFNGIDAKGMPVELKAELNHRFAHKEEAVAFLEQCKQSEFRISNITKRPAQKSPAAPFTTSTLQQEAARKLGFSVSQTMRVAQQLYEAGKITYMRTDSVHLSSLAINSCKQEIMAIAGSEYIKSRQFATKTKGAQEAHEAIRPTYISHHHIEGTAQEKRLYDLIWKRTIASQMSNAQLEKTTISINIENSPYQFEANGEVITFDGFLKVYMEGTDDEIEQSNDDLLPLMLVDSQLNAQQVIAQERFTQGPFRYTDASLVKKMEELGIGRPSTYAPTISTIQNRGYIEKGDKTGEQRNYTQLTLKNGKISTATKTEKYGNEKGKFLPTDIGIVVNDFLTQYFPDILNYNFTAEVEKQFDSIAEGEEQWIGVIDNFYKKFHPTVTKTLESSDKKVGERILGIDPVSNKQISVKIGRYGLIAQIGLANDEEKPIFAPLKRNQSLETITLEEALELFKLPRTLGEYEEAEIAVATGRFGPYLKHAGKYYSLSSTDDPLSISIERAIEIINAKRQEELNKIIHTFGDIQVLNGRYGPYITSNGINYKIPKGQDAQALTEDQCKEIMNSQPAAKKKPFRRGSKK